MCSNMLIHLKEERFVTKVKKSYSKIILQISVRNIYDKKRTRLQERKIYFCFLKQSETSR